MNLNEYLEFTDETATYPPLQAKEYLAFGLASEVGEVLGKMKKEIRDDVSLKQGICSELGDVLWYWVRLCDEFGFDPQDVMAYNVTKLTVRKRNNTIRGSGDVR